MLRHLARLVFVAVVLAGTALLLAVYAHAVAAMS
jgi:hypothetical protein